jgi:3-hydroxyisobutyrate dehydrogenase-like beta-hydroxyacid dehydrogenase
MATPLRIAVLGHDATSKLLAAGLQEAGANVIGYDLKMPKRPTTPMAETVAEAVADADLVLSLNSSIVALRMAELAAPHLKPGVLFADLNAGTPAFKQKLAEIFPPNVFLDVAVMGSLKEQGISAPLIVAGPSAEALISLLTPLGLNLQHVSQQIGDAAARELTRSVLTKCIAGVVVDYMWAADQLGVTDWAYEELQREFNTMNAETAKGYLRETVHHVKRREIEMLDVVEMLEGADYHSLFVPQTQLVYNKIYHSIPVPFSEPEDDDD